MSRNDSAKLIYEHYYQNIISTAQNPDPRSTLHFYDDCYGWSLPTDKQIKILDFGAGTGKLMFWLKERGYLNVVGVDLSPEQAQMAKTLSGQDVTQVDDPLQFLGQNKGFGLIFMSDVIEHISKWDQPSYLNAMHGALELGGQLVIKTENISSPVGVYQHSMDYTHEYNFTELSLRQLLLSTGFKDIQIRGERYPWSWRPVNIKRAIVRGIWFWLLKQLYDAERPSGNNPTIFSKSLICVCRSA